MGIFEWNLADFFIDIIRMEVRILSQAKPNQMSWLIFILPFKPQFLV